MQKFVDDGELRAALKQEVAKLNEQAKPFMDLFVKTTDLVLPSVVSVSTVRTVEMQENPFGQFFGPFDNPLENPFQNPNPWQREQPRRPFAGQNGEIGQTAPARRLDRRRRL